MANVSIQHITKIFGNNPEKALRLLKDGMSKQEIFEKTGLTVGVNDVSLEIEEGRIFVIMGLSGSGKSTLLRMINRLIKPTSGSIYIDGQDIVKMSNDELRKVRQEKLSMVFQNFGLFPHRTILENVGYGLEIQGKDENFIKEKAQTAIDTVGLKGWEDSFPNQLSGGMQQRVGLARALASGADILLMDEAFSALDPLNRKDMQDELLELQDKMQRTIIFITHDLNEALKLGDRIAIMRDGALIQEGTPEEILTHPANEYVERFIEDATISRVITVQQIMKKPYAILLNRGPRVALKLMRNNGISDLFVINSHREVQGIVNAKGMMEARDRGLDIVDKMVTDVPIVAPETTLDDAVSIAANTNFPIAVVDDDGKLIGAAVKGAILGGLSGEFNSADEEVLAQGGGAHE